MAVIKWLVEKLKPLMPKQSTLLELLGFFILGFGIFLGLALFTYDPSDYQRLSDEIPVIENLGGPAGARLAHLLLVTFGLGSVLIALIFSSLGALMVLGFVQWPQSKRFVGFALLLVTLCGLIHIQKPIPNSLHLPYGLGGVFGRIIGNLFLKTIGYGGAMLGLSFAAIISLVATGNLTLSGTARFFEYLGYWFARMTATQPKSKKSRHHRIATLTTPAQKKEVTRIEDKAEVTEMGPMLDLSSSVPRHAKPEAKIFQTSKGIAPTRADYAALSKELEKQLSDFKIEGRITHVTVGPVVTTLEYEPTAGTKSAKIVAIADDMARMLKAQSVRIIPSLPGKSTVGIEIPSETRTIIRFGDVIKSAKFRTKEVVLPVALGVDTFGHPAVEDLVQMPHLLVAGTTGSGKSVFINNLIAGLVSKNTAKEMRFVFIDPKMVELAAYKNLPHLACPVISDVRNEAKMILSKLVDAMENRYEMMLAVEARNIQEFNEVIATKRKTQFVRFNGDWQPLPYVVFLIDEFADLILTLGKPAEELITRLAQKARAAGIHLVIATQRPSVDVVTGLIKANFPTRIAFRVQSGVDSRTILDQIGAEALLGKGDMLYQSAGSIQRLHAALLEDSEVKKLASSCV